MIVVNGRNCSEAWFSALKQAFLYKINYYTGHQMVAEASAVITFPCCSEPRIPRCIPTSLEGAEEYVREVLCGTKDHLIGSSNTAWEYTYHQRIKPQIPYILDKLACDPETRQAFIMIGDAKDHELQGPPCLQKIWFGITGPLRDTLEMHVNFRSNDALKASALNMFALTRLQQMIAKELELYPGYYVHFADSYHIYRRDEKLCEAVIKELSSRTPNMRGFNWRDEWKEYMDESIPDTDWKSRQMR